MRRLSWILLGLILIGGIFLRLYKLGEVPPGLTWDEASLGYNAYSVLKTGRDEYGTFLPLSFRSFDDYKPPLYIYLAVSSVAIFGLNEFAVRLPSALLGVLAVAVTYFLTRELFYKNFKGHLTFVVPALASGLLAVSPWHLQFSRAAFEGNVGLTFLLLGFLFFLKWLRQEKYLILSVLFFGISLYAYHSFRLVAPLFLVGLLVIFGKESLARRKWVFLTLLFFGFLAAPLVYTGLRSQEFAARLSMVTVFEGHDLLRASIERLEYDQKQEDWLGALFHNRRLEYARVFLKGYLDHWDPNFLILEGPPSKHHHAVGLGMLYAWEWPLLFFGLVRLLARFNKRVAALFLLLFLAPFPAAATTGTPHGVRAIAMIPALHIFTAVGVIELVNLSGRLAKSLRYPLFVLGFLFLALNFYYYLHQYYVHTPREYGDFWQSANKELYEILKEKEKNYERIIVTYFYDQPYIYYLFYNKVDPGWYQENWDYRGDGNVERFRRVIGKFEFRRINWGEDSQLEDTFIVATPNEIPEEVVPLKEIKFLNGETAFLFVET